MRSTTSDCTAKLKIFKATDNKVLSGDHCKLCIDRRIDTNTVTNLALTDITNLPSNPVKKLIVDYSQEFLTK